VCAQNQLHGNELVLMGAKPLPTRVHPRPDALVSPTAQDKIQRVADQLKENKLVLTGAKPLQELLHRAAMGNAAQLALGNAAGAQCGLRHPLAVRSSPSPAPEFAVPRRHGQYHTDRARQRILRLVWPPTCSGCAVP
jgi:hypothetical protein